MTSFARLLKTYRERASLSMNKLAKEVGINPSYISRIENEDRNPPRRDLVIKIGKKLHLKIDELNQLLESAGFVGEDPGKYLDLHPSMKLYADILDDERVTPEDKEFIERAIKNIHLRYHKRDESQPAEE